MNYYLVVFNFAINSKQNMVGTADQTIVLEDCDEKHSDFFIKLKAVLKHSVKVFLKENFDEIEENQIFIILNNFYSITKEQAETYNGTHFLDKNMIHIKVQ